MPALMTASFSPQVLAVVLAGVLLTYMAALGAREMQGERAETEQSAPRQPA